MLTTAGINAGQLRTAIDQALSRLPQVEGTGGDVQPSQDLVRVLNLCDKLAQKQGDNFISSELFVLAALESRGSLADLLKSAGATTANITQAIQQMRGGERERSKCRRPTSGIEKIYRRSDRASRAGQA
ncbi:Clp protease N-terminal domain-containing protein [Pseudocitrobacter faecalis]